MRGRLLLAFAVLMTGVAATAVAVASSEDERGGKRSSYEVWTIDQSDTRSDGGGSLYVYDGRELTRDPSGAQPEKVDLGGAVRDLCLSQTGSAPRRPHMIVFNGGNDSTDGNSRVALAFVVSGHVAFLDADTREPIECLDTGAQAHAVWPSPDQSQLIVANQNDKKLSRIATDYNADQYELETDATLDLANGTTPSGAPRQDPALRPDNAPICPRTDDGGRVTFVTLRGGGMFVVDHHQTPMAIVAEYDKAQVHANGCGGIQANDKMYINSGAGTLAGNPSEHDVYAFDVKLFGSTPNPPNTPPARLVYDYDTRPEADSHGVLLTKHEKFLWVGDRQANTITTVNTRNDEIAEEFTLEGEASSDPAPDLLDISPKGDFVFAALRGPNPQSGGHSAFGNSPGVGVIDVRRGGRSGHLDGVARVSNVVGGLEQADPHAIRVRVIDHGSHDDN
ncbi:MAG: hypothetical protein M3356_06395 [Actinomycetota bacterium]|nr:hypothetical protein [Actinomycetota bacterium]